MINLPLDNNNHLVQCAKFGEGYEYADMILPKTIKGLVRIKNIGDTNAIIKYADDNSEGVVLSPGETEYFYLKKQLEIVTGRLNIMS